MVFPKLASRNVELRLAGVDVFDVREFEIEEGLNRLFLVRVTAVSPNPDVDFGPIVGAPASFALSRELGLAFRRLTGVCSHIEQVGVESSGLSTYEITLVPELWFLTQRRNHRLFQQLSEIEIVRLLLDEWNIEHELRLNPDDYKARKLRIQYGESDHTFLSRLLEDAGVTYFFDEPDLATSPDARTRLVLTDKPGSAAPRAAPIAFVPAPNEGIALEFVTRLRTGQRVRPGKYTLRDHDYRRPADFPLLATARGGSDIEDRLERFHYVPGAFLFRSPPGPGDRAASDDRGSTRTDLEEAKLQAKKRLDAKRSSARAVTFDTSAFDVKPGMVMSVAAHPRAEFAPGKTLLVVASIHAGKVNEAWRHACEARFTDVPYRPPLATPKPRTEGVESATVVGPKGEEIHTDEFGRVRVHFHWDRESKMDERSSTWIHVSQSWGGSGFGGVNLPRVGQEVLVDFLGGDPDRPIIVGRVYTNLQKVPYALPANKTQSGWKSMSSPSRGPDAYNEIAFEDKAGGEVFRVQAERDMHTLVKRDQSLAIGRDRATTIERNDHTYVGNDQSLVVLENRKVNVYGTEERNIAKEFVQTSKASQLFRSKEFHIVEAGAGIILRCGDSFLVMTPECIVLEATRTFINPGPEGLARTLAGGRPETPDEAAERADLEDLDKNGPAYKAEMAKRWASAKEKQSRVPQSVPKDVRDGLPDRWVKKELEAKYPGRTETFYKRMMEMR